MLNPQAKALIELIESLALPPANELPVAEARKNYRDRRHGTQPPPVDVGVVRDHPLPVEGGEIAIREYRPQDASGVLPALLYFHGGGWTIGDLDTHDTLCRSLCEQAGCAVFSVDYRMGPEHKFPVAVQDAVAATEWLYKNAERLSVARDRIAIGGDSAGGNLAAVVSLQQRDQNNPPFALQLLIYPAVDQRAGHDSHRRNGEGYLLTRVLMDWFRDQYHGDPAEYLDWRASPLLADRFDGLPAAFVLTAEYDPLVDEGQAYARALTDAGVTVEHELFEGQIHGFITMGKLIDDANRAVSVCAEKLRAAFS